MATLNLALALPTALTATGAMRMVGVLLVSAMIVIPALSGFALDRGSRSATAWAIVVALVAVTVGPVATFYLRLAAGGAIVLTPLLIYALVSLSVRTQVRLGGGEHTTRARMGHASPPGTRHSGRPHLCSRA